MILEFKVELPQILEASDFIQLLADASNCSLKIESVPVQRGQIICEEITFSVSSEREHVSTFALEWDRLMRKMGRALKPI